MAPIWLRECDVVELVSLNEAIGALEKLLPLEAGDAAANGTKSLITWEGRNSLHALTAFRADNGYCGTKTWINTSAGGRAIYALFDSVAGKLLAVIEAGALGMLRTGGAAGLASKLLAPSGTDELTMIGSGRQALLQIAAIAVCLPLRKIRLFSRTRAHQVEFADKLNRQFGIPVETPETLEDALRDAGLVTVATRAREPFLSASMLGPDVHLNAIGALLPANAELFDDVVDRAGLIVVDNRNNVAATSREFKRCFEPGYAGAPLETLGERLASGQGRPGGAGLTIFKSVGMGLSDLAIATKVYESARTRNLGMALPEPVRATPRWTLAAQSNV